MNQAKQTYSQWLSAVDTVTMDTVGVSLQDLGHDFGGSQVAELRAEYEARRSPREAFDNRVRPELGRLGFSLEIAELFDEAQGLGRNKSSPRVLEEDSLYELGDPEDLEPEPEDLASRYLRAAGDR